MATQTGTKKTAIARGRTLALVYGAFCYLTFLVAALWAIGFVGNVFGPKTIDAGPGVSFVHAVLIDALLLGLFALLAVGFTAGTAGTVSWPARPSNGGGRGSFRHRSSAAPTCCSRVCCSSCSPGNGSPFLEPSGMLSRPQAAFSCRVSTGLAG